MLLPLGSFDAVVPTDIIEAPAKAMPFIGAGEGILLTGTVSSTMMSKYQSLWIFGVVQV